MGKNTYIDVVCGDRDNNIRFNDFRKLLLDMGFRERIRGDHYVYKREEFPERIVIQPDGSKAKPYQVKQVRNLILKYDLEV